MMGEIKTAADRRRNVMVAMLANEKAKAINSQYGLDITPSDKIRFIKNESGEIIGAEKFEETTDKKES